MVTVPTGTTYMPIMVLFNGLLAYSSTPFIVTYRRNVGIDANFFAGKVDSPAGSYPSSVSIGDLDGDGKIDLALVNSSNNTVSVIIRNINLDTDFIAFALFDETDAATINPTNHTINVEVYYGTNEWHYG